MIPDGRSEMIPNIDLGGRRPSDRARVAQEIKTVCGDVGFFVVSNHGLTSTSLDEIRALAGEFFGRPQEDKEGLSIQESSAHRGYTRIGLEKIDPDGPDDFRETFLIGWEGEDGQPPPDRIPLVGPNQWPTNDAAFSIGLKAYYRLAMELAQYLLECFAVSIGKQAAFFAGMFSHPLTNLVLANYPVPTQRPSDGVVGCGEHTDYGLITLLVHDGVPGLEIRHRNGTWLAAESAPDQIIVNVGDMMQFITGGRYISNPHRVRVMWDKPRVSVPFFVQPDYDALIRPEIVPADAPSDKARWKPRLAGAYIEERFAETFISPEQRALATLRDLDPAASGTLRSVADLLDRLNKGP